jgi:hypothetical protein
MAASQPSPLVQDFLQKLNSIGADFLWVFAVYQEQLRINKGLKDHIINLSASNELSRQTCDRAEQRITSLESLLFDHGSDCYKEISSAGSATLEQTQEWVKEQEEEIVHIKAENRRIQAEHATQVAEYQKALTHAGDLIIARGKKIEELEVRNTIDAAD